MRVAGTRPCTEVLRVPPARTSTSAVMPFSAQKSSISWVCARVPTSELQRDSDLRGAGGGGGRGHGQRFGAPRDCCHLAVKCTF